MIYFIQMGNDGPVKIGKAKDPLKRMDALKTGAPYKLFLLVTTNEHKHPESELHRRFAHLRLEGEWFRPEQEIFDFITELRLPDLLLNIQKNDSGTVVCRLCDLRFNPDSQDDNKKHARRHLEIKRGNLPTKIYDIFERLVSGLLHSRSDANEPYHGDHLKLAFAFLAWEKARAKGIPESAFEIFILDHLDYIDALSGDDKLVKFEMNDKINIRWSLYK